MTTTSTTPAPLTSCFALPGTHRYVEAVGTYNLSAELRPIGAVVATSRDHVLQAIREAVGAGHRVVPLSTGHAATMLIDAGEGAYLVRTALDEPVHVDSEAQTVTIPAGASWGEVATAAAEHGFAVAHGSSPSVGAIGYLLGGGLSFYGRLDGVAANHVTSITLAIASGEAVTVDASNDAELFWALRGGGGGFGVVLSVTLALIPRWKVITGSTAWDAGFAPEIAAAWHRWTQAAPRTITTSLRLLNLPDAPTTPALLRGRQVIMVDGAVAVPTEASADNARHTEQQLLEPLRAIADPLIDTWHVGPVTDLLVTHADPPDPLPYASDTFTLQGMTDAAIRHWVASAGPDSGSRLAVAELRQLGGAFAEGSPNGGAFSRLDGEFAAFNLGVLFTPDVAEQVLADTTRIREALTTHISGFTAPTFVENPDSPRRTFAAEVEERVEAVRSRIDPRAVFGLDARRSR